MALKDILMQGVTVSYTGVFNFGGFYKVLKEWFRENDYFTMERDYKETQKNGRKQLLIKIYADTKLDDYIKKVIEIVVNVDANKVEIKKNNRKSIMDHGTVNLSFTCYLLKDYEENYEKRPLATFLRELHDKFIGFPRVDKAKIELKDDAYAIMDEFKNYFKAFQ